MEATADDLAATLTPPGDLVEAVLAEALRLQVAAGNWSAVEQLARELEARGRARASVLDLAVGRTGAGKMTAARLSRAG